MDNNDLWPEFNDVPILISPKTVLTEQANFLSQKTKGLLTGQISTGSSTDGKILNHFRIVAPLLKGYSFKLFSISHDVFYYPCHVFYTGRIIPVEDGEGLRVILKEIFNSAETIKIVTSLLGQSKEAEE